jgi:hypothetical protein
MNRKWEVMKLTPRCMAEKNNAISGGRDCLLWVHKCLNLRKVLYDTLETFADIVNF